MNIETFTEIAAPLGVLGLKVTQNDVLIADWHSEPEMRRNIYSATKSFTSCAVGFAIQEGLLSLDEKLTEAFPKDLPEQVSDHLARATVRDLLTMCLGEKEPQLMGEQRPLYEEDDWVKMCLAFPLVNVPGTKFLYSNVGPYLAGVLVQRRAGCDLASYLTPRLFDHLGIRRPTWETDPQGYTFGAGGLFLTLSELHTFGLFCLHKGKWNGRQLLSADWIEECAKKQGPGPYGYLFWRGEYNSFRADGKFCQLSIIFPDKNAVISMVSECRDSDTLMKAIYEELCPQL